MRYAIVDGSGGITTNVIEWDGVTPFDPGPGLMLVPADQATPRPSPPEPQTDLMGIDILNRIGTEKTADIWAAAVQSPMLGVFVAKLLSARYIDRADPETLAACQALIQLDIVTQADVDAALA